MTGIAPRGSLPRLMSSWWRQGARQLPPSAARADGIRVLVTGGNGGIGLETARGLLERGATVTIACRNPDRARRACDDLQSSTGRTVAPVPCDLSDLDSVRACLEALGPVDAVVCNAGISPRTWSTTPQGHESAFGVNVLGHVLLVQGLLDRGRLAKGGQVVWVTGDIYVLASDCTPDFRFHGPWGSLKAYSRSKLGSLWMRHAFAEAYPEHRWYAVHPGIAATNLVSDIELSAPTRRMVGMIDARDAARTSIRCIVEDLPDGYHHNLWGPVHLHEADVGADRRRARDLYEHCRELIASWL